MAERGPEERFAARLAAARTGSEAAFAELFTDLHPRLLRFLRATEPRAADDLAGDVWMAVAGGISRFTGDEQAFRGFVFTIARRRVADHRRRAVRQRTEPAPHDDFADVAGDEHPDRDAIDRLSGEQAAALIAEILPPDQAEVVLLRVLGDLDVDQVAEIMGRTPNWVRVTQHRGIKRLGARLGPKIGVIR